ncbi:MAG: hypothetical protein AAGH89_17865 [Verrucomicrobiota bacterium]
MSQLHQMQITFVPEEDRLLFRLNTSGRQSAEFRFWLTRRYVRILWAALLNMLKKQQPKEAKQEEPIKQQMEMVKQHEEAIEKADFKTQYQESHVFPLGEAPILVSKVALKETGQNSQILCMHPQNGNGLEFDLNEQLLHSFCKLLTDSVKRAEWDLDLDFGQAEELISQRGLN